MWSLSNRAYSAEARYQELRNLSASTQTRLLKRHHQLTAPHTPHRCTVPSVIVQVLMSYNVIFYPTKAQGYYQSGRCITFTAKYELVYSRLSTMRNSEDLQSRTVESRLTCGAVQVLWVLLFFMYIISSDLIIGCI